VIPKEQLTDIFFDLDHTLWDFEKNSALTFDFIFKELNLSIDLKDFLNHYNPINHYYWKLYRENKISQEELRFNRLAKTFETLKFDIAHPQINQIAALYIEKLSTFTHVFEGAHELLQNLSKDYSLHIITNGFESVQHYKLANSGLQPYFEFTFTAEKVGFKKPHPKIFETAIQATQARVEHSLMVGDSLEADIEGALQCGMHTVHFNSHNESEHDKCPIVYSLNELNQMFN
jgi:putative hydrolase of the HAD superfamily